MISPPHYRRNFVAFLGEIVSFSVGFTFVSMTTVLPHLIERLGGNEVAVGMVMSVSSGAWLLPQLIYANLLTNKRRKKPYVTLGAVIARPVYLLYAVALLLGLHRQPTLALALLFGAQILFFAADGLSAVAWFDVFSKAIPAARRGRLIGGGQVIGGLLSIGAGGVIAAVLGKNGPPFPENYTVILALGGVCLLLGLVSWIFVIEPDESVQESRPAWRDYFPQLLSTLRQDRVFTRLILVRLLAGFDALALSFYILFATRELELPPETIGLFTVAQIVGRILASAGMGALAERSGSHRVVQVATGIGLTAPVLSLALVLVGAEGSGTTTAIFAWVFVAIGITMSSAMLGYFNYTLELAPAGQRPTYIGLSNTLTGVLVVLPAFGGWLLRISSYGVLFALTAAILIVAHTLSLRLPPAHQTSTQLQPEPAT